MADFLTAPRGRRGGAFPACLALLLAACSTSAPSPPTSLPAARESAFLASPLTGYPRSLSAAEAEVIRDAHRALLAGESAEAAAETARVLLDSNPGLEPAELLLAQVDLVRQRYAEAFERAAAIAQKTPGYLAAELVSGRSAEKLERIKDAYQAYLRAAPRSNLAASRARELRGRAVEVAANRTEDLLARGHLEEAGTELDLLESWAPGELRTLELVAAYSAEAGTPDRELAAVKGLLDFDVSNDLLRRRARLEMEAGDAGAGLRILEELTQQNPEDYELALELERAKFRWRLDLLPTEVRRILELPELTRGDFAKLLFWLFPDVRYGRASEGRIASDILDHPHQREIARVINLGLMGFDSTLHLFHPGRPLERQAALQAVLRVLAGRSPRPACLDDDDPRARMSVDRLCALAARCALFPEPGDCLPEATASGRFVEQIGFGALDVLGSE